MKIKLVFPSQYAVINENILNTNPNGMELCFQICKVTNVYTSKTLSTPHDRILVDIKIKENLNNVVPIYSNNSINGERIMTDVTSNQNCIFQNFQVPIECLTFI